MEEMKKKKLNTKGGIEWTPISTSSVLQPPSASLTTAAIILVVFLLCRIHFFFLFTHRRPFLFRLRVTPAAAEHHHSHTHTLAHFSVLLQAVQRRWKQKAMKSMKEHVVSPVVAVVLPLAVLPAISMYVLNYKFDYAGVTLCLANAPVPCIAASVLWLYSRRLAQLYIKSTGHRCRDGNETLALVCGVSRTSPVFPALMALMLLLFAFWHLIAAILFALIEASA